MNSPILKSNCLCILAVTGLLLPQLNAAVVVFQASPTQIEVGESFLLDIDNNGVDDYRIISDTCCPEQSLINGLNANNLVETNGQGYVVSLVDGWNVGNNWFENQAVVHYENSTEGLANDITRSVGLKFQVGGNTHYGYIRIRPTDYNGSTLIFDYYGYETTPNQTIQASAQAITSIGDPFPGIFNIKIIDRKLEVITSTAINRMELMDMSGKTIRLNMPQQSSIDIAGLPKQIYFLALFDDKGIKPLVVKKLILGE